MENTLKLIISDDERLAREGLRDNIPWDKLGYEVVGCAENGQRALELAAEYNAQIIITDIMMPELNGLDFIEKISASKQKVLVVIVSA